VQVKPLVIAFLLVSFAVLGHGCKDDNCSNVVLWDGDLFNEGLDEGNTKAALLVAVGRPDVSGLSFGIIASAIRSVDSVGLLPIA